MPTAHARHLTADRSHIRSILEQDVETLRKGEHFVQAKKPSISKHAIAVACQVQLTSRYQEDAAMQVSQISLKPQNFHQA